MCQNCSRTEKIYVQEGGLILKSGENFVSQSRRNTYGGPFDGFETFEYGKNFE